MNFNRTELLLGTEAVNRLRTAKVIIFGVGGVGSWCAEALIRTGIEHLTIVDSDTVSPTNLNRQLMATTDTIGKVKVDVLRNRLLEINPDADITAIQGKYNSETCQDFQLETYNYVIDAIDSLRDKAHLILQATRLSKDIAKGIVTGEGVAHSLTLFSSMGAALRIDPTMVRTAEFWKVKNDTLARALRRKFKHDKEMPAAKFRCVYSEEPPLPNLGIPDENDTCDYKVQINGSLCHITAIFGMTLAGMVINDVKEYGNPGTSNKK